ncbi:hypothetical protein HBI37_166220 [Parastagonospora nodorum]|nr:hypothetical protein HBI37_166220 [Parastagonospora nodorum]KAH6345545.1 hypothetical protein HBI36_159400 [Parastagonospora nodorum]
MDFSNNVFSAPASTPKVSDDTMSHANLVMACRWGWTSSPDSNGASSQTQVASSTPQSAPSPFNNVRSKRFAPCQGRLYHQLLCSHRIRTDLVEDCGANCIEPFGNVSGPAFICNECMHAEAAKIWEERKAQHLASYPPTAQMTKEQYDRYYLEHRQLEADYARDRRAYEMDLKAKMRPSNICSAIEVSKEEAEFATELDSLSLSLMASNDGTTNHAQFQQHTRPRVSLPTDASEQLHWDLNTLALERGSCGVEYTAQGPNSASTSQGLPQEELWGKPRG